MRTVLIDTNAYTRLLAGSEEVLDAISSTDRVYMSIFVLGELHAGFGGGKKERQNRAALGRFLEKPTVKVLNATSETAEVFGFVKSNLKRAGTPLPINDVWIAAHTLETGSVLDRCSFPLTLTSGRSPVSGCGKRFDSQDPV